MSDVDHAAEIRHKAEVITLTTDSIAERYGLSEYIVGKFREEAREIKHHANELQRERDEAREALAAERARVNDLEAFLRYHDRMDEVEEVVGDPRLRRSVLGDLPDDDEGEVTP